MEVVARATPAIRARRGAAIPLILQNLPAAVVPTACGLGVPLEAEAQLRVGWPLRSRNQIAAIHIHWPQGLYRHHGRAAAELVRFRAARRATRRRAAARVPILWTVHQLYPHEQRHGLSIAQRAGCSHRRRMHCSSTTR
jgi:hypothetical protein